jgi:hypothetical protein
MKDRPDVFAARKQYGSDIQRQYGTLGAASVVRRVEVSAVDATALVAQMEEHTARAEAQRLLGGRGKRYFGRHERVGWGFGQPILA